MRKTHSLDSLYDIISYLQDNKEKTIDIDTLIQRLSILGEKWKIEREELIEEIAVIRNQNEELSNKLDDIYQKLDTLKERVPDSEYSTHLAICERKYIGFWEKLDEDSKEYIATAHYLLDFIKAMGSDYAPIIIEYCRAIENEMTVKIFSRFIELMSVRKPLMPREYGEYKSISDAVEDNARYQRFFLSASNMVKALSALRNSTITSSYKWELYGYLKTNNWNIRALTSPDVLRKLRTYINSYRNQAAHPGVVMTYEEAIDCQTQTGFFANHIVESHSIPRGADA